MELFESRRKKILRNLLFLLPALLLILICVPVCVILFFLLIPVLLILMIFFSLLSNRGWNGGLRWYSSTTFPRGGRQSASPAPEDSSADCDIECIVIDSKIVDPSAPDNSAGQLGSGDSK